MEFNSSYLNLLFYASYYSNYDDSILSGLVLKIAMVVNNDTCIFYEGRHGILGLFLSTSRYLYLLRYQISSCKIFC